MIDPHGILLRKLREHSRLSAADIAGANSLRFTIRHLAPNEDFIRQGDEPDASAVVVEGMVARYHLLGNGKRQYLSFHMTGDMPDAQALFVERMDHAVCAVNQPAAVALIPHKDIMTVIKRRPELGFAIWRETLIDAAIFREAITNNSARSMRARMAHLFCEIYYRARASRLTDDQRCSVPITLPQLGEALGMGIATVNRTLNGIRRLGAAELRQGILVVRDWRRLTKIGEFDPHYLHMRQPASP